MSSPQRIPGAYEEFTRYVVPELQRRGLYHKEYKGTTLRSNLGCPVIDKNRKSVVFCLRIALRRTEAGGLKPDGRGFFWPFNCTSARVPQWVM